MGLFKPNIIKMRAKKNVSGLIKALSYKDKNIQLEAIRALGDIGSIQGVDPIIELIGSKDFRYEAVKALGKIGDKRAVKPLIYALDEWNTSDVIEKMIDAEAIEPLVVALQDITFKWRYKIPKLLQKTGDKRVLEPLLMALKDPDAAVRSNAVESLGLLDSSHAVEPLLEALHDADSEVRYNAVKALWELDDLRVVIPILNALQHNDESLYGSVKIFLDFKLEKFLDRIDNNAVLESLIPALKVNDSEVFLSVIQAFGKLDDKRAAEPIIDALKGRSVLRFKRSEDFEKIAGVLVKLGLKIIPDNIPQTIQVWLAIKSHNWDTVIKYGGAAVDPLIEAFWHGDDEVELKSAELLGILGDKRAVEPLVQRYKISYQYNNAKMYNACYLALKNLGVTMVF